MKHRLAQKLRDMHALAADSCDPEFNRALLEAAGEIEHLLAHLETATDALELWGATGHVPTDLKSLIVEFRATLGHQQGTSDKC